MRFILTISSVKRKGHARFSQGNLLHLPLSTENVSAEYSEVHARGEMEETSTHNKRGCAILTKKVVPKNPGTYLKLRPKNLGTRNARLSFYVRKFTTQIRRPCHQLHIWALLILSKDSTI